MKYKTCSTGFNIIWDRRRKKNHDTLRVQIEKKMASHSECFKHSVSNRSHENKIKKLEISLSNIFVQTLSSGFIEYLESSLSTISFRIHPNGTWCPE